GGAPPKVEEKIIYVNNTQSTEPRLEYSELPVIEVKRGRDVVASFKVTNTGGKFLNDCQLVPDENFEELFVNNQVEDFTLGQTKTYTFSLSIPKDFELGKHKLDVKVVCDETSLVVPLEVHVSEADFNFEIISTEKKDDKLFVKYRIEELLGRAQEILLSYALVDRDNIPLAEGSEKLKLKANEKSVRELVIDLPKNAIGIFQFNAKLESENDVQELSQRVVLPRGAGLTGLAISDDNKRALGILGAILLVLVFAFLTYRNFVKFKQSMNQPQAEFYSPRDYIPVDSGLQEGESDSSMSEEENEF
ncbi:hypothetical protein D6817_05065, partial [Candidatus Pacearchaeota archaeon]